MTAEQTTQLLESLDSISSSIDALGVVLLIVLGIIVALLLTSRR